MAMFDLLIRNAHVLHVSQDGETDVLRNHDVAIEELSLIHISEPTRLKTRSRMPSSA